MPGHSSSAKRKLGWIEPEDDSLPTPIVSNEALKNAHSAKKQSTNDDFIAFGDFSSTGGSATRSMNHLSTITLNSQPGVDPEIAPLIHNLPSVLVNDHKRRQCGILKQFVTPRHWVRDVDRSYEDHDFTVAQYRKLWKYAVSQVDIENGLYIEVLRRQHPGLGDRELWDLVRKELPAVVNKIYDPKVATADKRYEEQQPLYTERLKTALLSGREEKIAKVLRQGHNRGFVNDNAYIAAEKIKNEKLAEAKKKLSEAVHGEERGAKRVEHTHNALDEANHMLPSALTATAASAAQPKASALEGRRLFIGKVTPAATEKDLVAFFKDFVVESTSLPRNKRNGPTGYAFVTLSSPVEAARAIVELSDKMLLDREVSLQIARPTETGRKGQGGSKGKGSHHRPSGRGRY